MDVSFDDRDSEYCKVMASKANMKHLMEII
jgi:hypothetical protein